MSSYKPERPVTSEKIKRELDKLGVRGANYKRKFKKRSKVSQNWVRGYVNELKWTNTFNAKDAIAISTPDDCRLIEVYLVDNAADHAKSLGIEEVFNSD